MPNIKKNIFFRVDASLNIGTGHVSRCIALADQLKLKNINSFFICRKHKGHLANKIKKNGHKVILLPVSKYQKNNRVSALGDNWIDDSNITIKYINKHKPSWLVVDHYDIATRWESKIKKETKIKILVIDGQAQKKHNCDILLDQSFSSEEQGKWKNLISKNCKLLTGFKYALLRKEFLVIRDKDRFDSGKIKRVFVGFGGTDFKNVSSYILNIINILNLSNITFDLVIGKNTPHLKEIVSQSSLLKNVKIHIGPSNVAKLMLNADFAISAGGSMLLEQCYLRVPSLVISTAKNQILSCQALHEKGCIIYLGKYETVNKKLIIDTISAVISDYSFFKKMKLKMKKMTRELIVPVSNFLLE